MYIEGYVTMPGVRYIFIRGVDQSPPQLALGCLLLMAGVWVLGAGSTAWSAELNHENEYRRCMVLAKSRPKDGFEAALEWRSLGGGTAADHCAAVALIELGSFEEAATRLERLAKNSLEEPKIKAGLYGQAGQAWLLAGRTEPATNAFSSAIALAPMEVDFYVDRAQAWAARKDFAAAETDLSKALQLSPSRADVYALRASARRFLDLPAAALTDTKIALELEPNNPEALLERGILRRLAGDKAGARADWMKILNGMPDSDAADPARKNIELMDVKPDAEQPAPPKR